MSESETGPLTETDALQAERGQVLERLQDWLEVPMLVLALGWLALFVVEVVWGLNPFLEALGVFIWVLFAFEFALDLVLAPDKVDYFKRNWLKAIALLAPALRMLRVLRIARLARLTRLAGVSRGSRLLRVVSSINRGMRTLGASMGRRGMGYAMLITLIVVVVGAAGMYTLENEGTGARGFRDFGDALWWTAMLMTTMGSSYWPETAAGRFLCLLLSLYAFAVFGYVTAVLASFFVGRDAEDPAAEVAGAASIERLREEIAALRGELRDGIRPAS
ncbi:ion transporter [Lysobacter sp. A3-1-A15]|uniref:ion transporter n=1 Tax=Novilysobacter viscosus TaxID=3098602 RepID=UPI002ED99B22